jgi:hypothetical protein
MPGAPQLVATAADGLNFRAVPAMSPVALQTGLPQVPTALQCLVHVLTRLARRDDPDKPQTHREALASRPWPGLFLCAVRATPCRN